MKVKLRSRAPLIWLSLLLVGSCSHDRGHAVSPRAEASSAGSNGTIDLALREANPLDALRTLARTAGISIFADSDIEHAGLVTMDAHAEPWTDVLAKLAADHELRVEKLEVRGAKQPCFWVSRRQSAPAPVTTFVGDRITTRFDETPIRDAVATLANVAKANIIVDDGLQQNITLHLNVPWDLALYHLAQKYDLRIVRGEKEIRVTTR